ncbi:MAG: NAD(P)-dependent oxidoreductase, partial [Acidobacteria bacterium]
CLPSGVVHVSMSTISPPLALRLAHAHQAAGQGFVSAPVFGRPDVAEAGRLWVVVAGQPGDVEKCRPVVEALSAGYTVVGEQPFLANIVKLAGNFALASAIETLAEAFALVRKSGVHEAAFLEVIAKGVPWSRVYEGYGAAIAAERFEPAGFSLALGLKDMRLALQVADAAAVPMPLLSVIRDQLLQAWAQGEGERDWSVLGAIAAKRAGIGGRE